MSNEPFSARAATFGNPDRPAEGRIDGKTPSSLDEPGPQNKTLAGQFPAFQDPPPTEVNGMPIFCVHRKSPWLWFIVVWVASGVAQAADPLSARANSTAPASSTPNPEGGAFDAARGKTLFVANCAACHQANGEGLPRVFPPLKGSSVVNKDDATKHIHVVLNGLQGGGRVSGVVYASPMPGFGNSLSDADIADIVDYERSAWGNHGKFVSAGEVAAERRASTQAQR